ncbi:MAG: hypothetical protein H6739_29790 [Alphaproteobacteria bacterium]|nr:hypothetical protein [Alphaproteobacteria bacterium]
MRYEGMLDRLSRRMPGERQQGLSPLALDLAARGDRKVLEPQERKARESHWDVAPRELHPRVRPEPNAPQLIRLVRHPYVQDTTRGRRAPYRDALPRLSTPEKLGHPMREATEARPEVGREAVAEVRDLPAAPWRPWQLVWTDQEVSG